MNKINLLTYHVSDAVRIVWAPAALKHLEGRRAFITEIHPTRPEHNLPHATLHLSSKEEPVTISTVFLQMEKPFDDGKRFLATATAPPEVKRPEIVLQGAQKMTRAEAIRAGQQRRADELGISLKEYFARSTDKRLIAQAKKKSGDILPVEATPAPAPLAPRQRKCRRCGSRAPEMAGVSRCEQWVDGRRCGGPMETS